MAAEVVDLEAAARGAELGVVARDLEVGDDELVLQGTADAHDAADGDLVERRRAAVVAAAVAGRRGLLRHAALLLRHERLLRLVLRLLRLLLLGGLVLRLLLVLRRLLLVVGLVLLVPGGLLRLVGRRLERRGLALRGRGLEGRLLLSRHAGARIQPRAVRRVAQVDRRTGHELRLLDPRTVHVGAVGAAVVLDGPNPAVPADGGVPPGHAGVIDHHVSLGIAPQRVRPGRIERPGPSVQFQYEFRHSSPT
ncbi:hypothetical protein GCM10010302_16480 [Streptomyces polychromogenes]|uniref:Uncharacterized protein n=1 Tax=Streptomyces polychromogenes TaxID=67342 RepID=A0ABP3EWN9_9ACTN